MERKGLPAAAGPVSSPRGQSKKKPGPLRKATKKPPCGGFSKLAERGSVELQAHSIPGGPKGYI